MGWPVRFRLILAWDGTLGFPGEGPPAKSKKPTRNLSGLRTGTQQSEHALQHQADERVRLAFEQLYAAAQQADATAVASVVEGAALMLTPDEIELRRRPADPLQAAHSLPPSAASVPPRSLPSSAANRVNPSNATSDVRDPKRQLSPKTTAARVA